MAVCRALRPVLCSCRFANTFEFERTTRRRFSRCITEGQQQYQSVKKYKMELSHVVSLLHKFAPKHLAAEWDNVGLLVEPTSPHQVSKILLTNDLTEPVLEEALDLNVNMIYSYHPPLFQKFNRATCTSWKERIMIRCLENRIAVFSPHTTLDVLPNGLNDWLISAFDVCDVRPIIAQNGIKTGSGYTHSVLVNVSQDESDLVEEVKKELENKLENKIKFNYNRNASELVIRCEHKRLPQIISAISVYPSLLKDTHVTKEELLPLPGAGIGRTGQLKEAVTFFEAVQRVKNHLGLEHVRLGIAYGSTLESTIKTVAVCAGSGESFLPNVLQHCDLYVTGEMKHHETLHAVSSGLNVILCEHSNSERGFLPILAPRLENVLNNKVEIVVSAVDKDPLVCT